MSAPAAAAAFSHVLCWVDGSDEACRAAERAALLAQSLGASLSFIAVGQEPEDSRGFEDYARIEGVSEPMSPSIHSDAAACLDQAISIAKGLGVEGAARVIGTGDAVTAICNVAREQNADLVVIRRRQTSLVERLLGGSMSGRLENGCEFAVLSVG
jgi:nucleotide-binding universal stress UspA family protein